MDGLTAILEKIGFDWQVAFVNLVNFLIIFFLLNRFAFKPLKKVIDAREAEIAEGLRKSVESDAILKEAEKQKDEVLLKAEHEAHGIVSSAHAKGEKILEEYEIKGARVFDEKVLKARDEIAHERLRAEDEVKEYASVLIASGVERFIQSDLTVDQKKKIKSTVAR